MKSRCRSASIASASAAASARNSSRDAELGVGGASVTASVGGASVTAAISPARVSDAWRGGVAGGGGSSSASRGGCGGARTWRPRASAGRWRHTNSACCRPSVAAFSFLRSTRSSACTADSAASFACTCAAASFAASRPRAPPPPLSFASKPPPRLRRRNSSACFRAARSASARACSSCACSASARCSASEVFCLAAAQLRREVVLLRLRRALLGLQRVDGRVEPPDLGEVEREDVVRLVEGDGGAGASHRGGCARSDARE